MARTLLVLFLTVLCWSVPVLGQVNVEPLRRSVHEEGPFVQVRSKFSGRAGNSQAVTLGADLTIGYSLRPHVLYVNGVVDYIWANGTYGAQKAFLHTRYNYMVRPWLWWEVYGQVQTDPRQLITVRQLVGTGPRMAIYQSGKDGLFLGVSYLVEEEWIQGPSTYRRRNRLSSYLSLTFVPEKRVYFLTVLYAQPRLSDWSDARLMADVRLETKVFPLLSMAMAVTGYYNTNPLPTVVPFDMEVKSDLTFRF